MQNFFRNFQTGLSKLSLPSCMLTVVDRNKIAKSTIITWLTVRPVGSQRSSFSPPAASYDAQRHSELLKHLIGQRDVFEPT